MSTEIKEKTIGGITKEDTIAFAVRIMLGNQYNAIVHANEEKDIIVACLRLGWNDAFRHVTKNKDENMDKYVSNQLGYSENYDSYIKKEILRDRIVLDAFKEYVQATKTDDKVQVLTDRISLNLLDKFSTVKMTTGDKRLCFGHLQKMFNIAIKMYLCVYMLREYIPLKEEIQEHWFESSELVDCLQYADCPVDSIILDTLGSKVSKTDKEEGKKIKSITWSKIGTEPSKSVQDYIDVQRDMQKQLEKSKYKGCCNLKYDFLNWNN